MSTAEKSIIIIGAGLAGLSAGCYAQVNGYHSRIFEHHSKPGGVAAAWKRKDYLIDGGIHFLMGHRAGQPIFELYRELGITGTSDFPTMTTYGRFVDEATGIKVDITGDLDRMAGDLKAIAAEDSALIDGLITCSRSLQNSGILYQAGMGKPPELMSFPERLQQFWDMRKVFKYFTGNYAKAVADFNLSVHSQMLWKILENLFLPEVPVWFVCMLLGLLADRQIGLLPGGCPGFVKPIVDHYHALGGEISYGATVEEIIIEEARASGVRLSDGSMHRADAVISAADGYSTIFKMLGGRYVDERIQTRYSNWKLIRPVVMVSFGVARLFPDEPHFSCIMLKYPIDIGTRAVNSMALRLLNYGTGFASPGKTVVQVMLETEWNFWNELQKERQRYNAEKGRVAREVIERLELHYPGISSLAEVTDVATPYTAWRYTLNHQGAYMGWLPTPQALMTAIPRTLPGLANFYMAGQWVLAGGGVPPCLYSGRHAVQLLCRHDRKPFLRHKG